MLVNKFVKGRYSTYQLQDLIGKGANAVVYSAVDCRSGEIFAVKKMFASDDTVMAAWRKEVAILNSLRNPYVIRYVDHARSGNDFLIVTEYAPGGSLLQQLKRKGHFSEREVARYMLQITTGLAYIHEKELLHRDLKCANVLIGDGGTVKLSDFGLAMARPVVHDDTNGGENGAAVADVAVEEGIVGSVYWMAPETIRGEPQSESSDVWSLGCLCVELLTGSPPFYDRAPANALYHIAELGEVPIPKMDLSVDCESFLRECLNRDPTKRPSARALLQDAWFGGFVAEDILEKLASTQMTDVSAEQVNENSAAISQWVVNNIFQVKAALREQWLEAGCLKKVIAVLPKVTADASFEIIRSLSFSARQCDNKESCFLTKLGETDLWDNERLSVLGSASSLSSIFVSCCKGQDPQVPQYAPTHPGALRFLLQCEDENIVIQCIDALHDLMVDTENDDGSSSSVSLQHDVPSVDNTDQMRFRRFVSQNRFVADHAVYAVQRIIEDDCCAAFHEEKEPAIGWKNMDKLFEVLLHVFKKTDEECVIVGPSTATMQKADGVAESSNAPPTASTGDNSLSVTDGGARAVNETGARSSAARGASITGGSVVSTVAAATANVGGVGVSGGATGVGASGEKQAEGRWLLSLQEASRHLCLNAISLLLIFVRHAVKNGLKSLSMGGKSIAGTFLVVASNASIDVGTRIALLRCLPSLQCASPKAAAFIRDTRCSVPLLAHAAKSIPVLEDAREDEVMKILFSLCEDERMATVCASSDDFLDIALEHATLSAHRHRWGEVLLAIRFIEILLAYSVESSRVVESHGLLQLLLQLCEDRSCSPSVSSAAQRLLNSVQVQTNVL